MSDDESITPSFRELLRRRIEAETARMRTMLPGVVVSYDAAAHRASVQPELQRIDHDQGGHRTAVTMPICNDVPVGMLGTRRVRVKFELKKGDPVMLIVASSSIARWREHGGIVDPGSDHHHHLADAIAIPFHFGHGEVEDPTTIEITDTEILAGGSAKVALLSDASAVLAILTDATVMVGLASASVDGGTAYLAAINNLLATTYATWPVGAGKLRG